MHARAMTEAADKESAAAEVSTGTAANELAAKEKAEAAVRKAEQKHREVSWSVVL